MTSTEHGAASLLDCGSRCSVRRTIGSIALSNLTIVPMGQGRAATDCAAAIENIEPSLPGEELQIEGHQF